MRQWDQIVKLMDALNAYEPSFCDPEGDEYGTWLNICMKGQVFVSDSVSLIRAIPDGSVDLFFTDEPYGIIPTALSFVAGEWHEFDVDWDDGLPSHLTMPWVKEAARALKPGGMLINSGFPEWSTTFKEVVRMAGLEFKGTIPWLKPGGVHMRKVNYKSAYEVFWWASKGSVKETLNFQEQMEMRNWVLETFCPKCMVRHPVVLSKKYIEAEWMKGIEWDPFLYGVSNTKGRVNETQKPEWLARKFLITHSKEGDLVVDPFCGSGTYLAIAVSMGRHVIGGDVRDEQVSFARQRIERQTMSVIK